MRLREPRHKQASVEGRSVDSQPIAYPRLSYEELGPGRLVLDLVAEIADIHVQYVELLLIARSPHFTQQLMMGDYLSGVCYQHPKQAVFGGRQLDLPVLHCHQSPRQVNLQITTGENGFTLGLSRTPQGSAQTSQKLSNTERFRHVVISARIKRRDLVAFRTPDRQYDDRDLRPFPKQACDLNSVDIRQAQVKYNHVRLVGRHIRQCVGCPSPSQRRRIIEMST